MGKPNRLLLGDVSHVMDPEYLAGARAARSGRATGRGAAAWRAGERNEQDLEHVRFGNDLLALPQARRDIPEDPDLPRLAPRGDARPLHRDAALLAYMEATQSLREAGIACSDSDWLPSSWRWADPAELARIRSDGATDQLMRPALLRDILARRGIPVCPDMAKALLRRLGYERRSRPEPLSYREETALDGLRPEARTLVGALASRQATHWTADPLDAEVESDARRPRGWCSAVIHRLREDGLGFLVHTGDGGRIRLTGKGCTARIALARTPARGLSP